MVDEWLKDQEYVKLFRETLVRIDLPNLRAGIAVGGVKGYILIKFAAYAALLDGDFAEFGTWAGGSARMIAKTIPGKVLHVFDTFEGVPYADERYESKNWVGQFKMDNLFETVKRVLDDCKNVRIYKGVFPGTTKDIDSLQKFAFVHSDADVYQSTVDSCEFFYPRLVVGGVMVFDDYGYEGAPGAKKAVDEYFIDKPENPSILSTGQAIVIKTYEE